MLKIARIIGVIAVLLLNVLIVAVEVRAATWVDVTVTVTPEGLFAPTDFDAVYINDNKVTLTWVANPLAVTTRIRGKVGSYPTDATDGYLVYDGAGVTCDDLTVSLDDTATEVYYRAWSVGGGGVLSPNYAQDYVGGVGMTLIAFFGGALALTWVGVKSNWFFRFLSSVFWFGILAFWLNGLRPATITAGSATDQIIVIFFFGIALGCLAYTFWYKVDGEGQSRGEQGFRMPFINNNEDEDDAPRRFAPSRQARVSGYADRINGALNGKRERRRY